MVIKLFNYLFRFIYLGERERTCAWAGEVAEGEGKGKQEADSPLSGEPRGGWASDPISQDHDLS